MVQLNDNDKSVNNLIRHMAINKLKSNDNYCPYTTMPFYDDFVFHTSIKEARGHGIPVASLSDTQDKIVFHPGHINKNKYRVHKYKYPFARGSWGDIYLNEDKNYNINKIYNALFKAGKKLSEIYDVYAVSINASGKGYLTIYFTQITSSTEEVPYYFDVLFVYCNDREILDAYS